VLEGPETVLNGTITNDKFCMTRAGRLHLSWWRRPLRSRPTAPDVSGYPADETSRRGGTHETSMEHPPSVPRGSRWSSSLGSRLPGPGVAKVEILAK
jgi:hypothetical protein